ncbi:MAG: hypothetical protein Q9162_006875 [Coniocarpon cinnabarinum]
MAAKMSYTLSFHARRAPHLSQDEFQNYMEDNHIPLLKRLAGNAFPIKHVMRYVGRYSHSTPAVVSTDDTADQVSNNNGVAKAVLIRTLVFADREHAERYQARMATTEAAEELQNDNAKFVTGDFQYQGGQSRCD